MFYILFCFCTNCENAINFVFEKGFVVASSELSRSAASPYPKPGKIQCLESDYWVPAGNFNHF